MTIRSPIVPEADRDFEVSIFKALADATRLRLLRLLYREELNVQELAHILRMGQSRISRHLAVLRNAALVQDRREGTKAYYTLAQLPAEFATFSDYLSALGRTQHPDLDRLTECLFSRSRQACSFADQAAEQWDEIGSLLHNSNASMLAMSQLAHQDLVVGDFGTGTGLMLPFLASLGKHVYAVDQSAQMLRQARLRCRGLGIENVTFIQSSIENLGQQVPPCDGVLLHYVLHQIARPQAAISRLHSLVRPGARLVIVDRMQHQDEKAKATFGSLWLGFSRVQIKGWLKKAGLKECYWHQLTQSDSAADGRLDVFVAAAVRVESACGSE